MKKSTRAQPEPRRRAKSIDEFARTYGVGRNSVYNEIAAGELDSITIGRRRLITEAQENAWLQRKEAAAGARGK